MSTTHDTKQSHPREPADRQRDSPDNRPAKRSAGAVGTRTAATEGEEPDVAVLTWLAGGVTVLSGIFTFYSGYTGMIARMARNHPVSTTVFVGLAIVAVGLSWLARVAVAQRKSSATAFTVLGIVCLTIGVVGAFANMTNIISVDDRPTVTAVASWTADGQIQVDVDAIASGLSAKDQLYLFAGAQDSETGSTDQVYYAVVGPDLDGNVHGKFTLTLPPRVVAVTITASRDSDKAQACTPQAVQESSDGEAVVIPTAPAFSGCVSVDIPPAPPEDTTGA